MKRPWKPRQFTTLSLGYFSILTTITLWAYAPVRHHGFLNYDDPQYITQNPNVTAGLTWQGVKWAFTTGYQANWHPLAWISHMLDVQFFGANAGLHHLSSLLFHSANTLLLFWILFQMTSKPGPSAFVAALFAVHPLHVESVAWLAERKDVLSTFFGLLTVSAYARYVRRPHTAIYLTVLGLFASSLMAKPMLVTLPFVLLLLDYWPLDRFTLQDTARVPGLIAEKIPLLMLAGTSSVITFFVQKAGGTVVAADALPVAVRIENGFIAYFSYLQRTFWPSRLSILYPAATTTQDWWWVAALALIGMSITAIWMAERRPYVFVGWFWYVGTLVPVIGLIQVGRQATADRYTYVPLIGLFLIIAFGISDLLPQLPHRKLLLAAGACLTISTCIWITRTQLQHWSSSQSLWMRAVSVTAANPLAQFNLAVALWDQGKLDEAIAHYAEAVRIDPTLRSKTQYINAQYNFGSLLINGRNREKLDEAAAHLTEALRGKPDFPEAHNALGIDYLAQGKLDQATAEFFEAVRLKPDYASAHNNLGTALGNQGQLDRAISEYSEAVRLDPGLAEAHTNLGILLAKQRDSRR
jgi:tetratricopeptide (TPR) repeat protein